MKREISILLLIPFLLSGCYSGEINTTSEGNDLVCESVSLK